MDRSCAPLIQEDLTKKMVILTGPRQVGKTYLSKSLSINFNRPTYLNFDTSGHRSIIMNNRWPLNTDYLVLDEIHKLKGWKSYLKGVWDGRDGQMEILVTGSARMDTFRQSGDSLAGRYFAHRLHPLSVGELKPSMPPREALDQILTLGGFPEPLLSGSEIQAARWRNQYYTDLIREDILDFSRIQELKAIRLLLEMLRERCGSPLSMSSLAGDLQISPNTVRKYLEILESLHIIFQIRPYHKNIARSLLKEPKIYFYDTGYVKGDEGIRLENAVACALLKQCHHDYDVLGKKSALHYLRTKDKKEVDFLIAKEGGPPSMLEVKLSDDSLSPPLKFFKKRYPHIGAIQLVKNLSREKHHKDLDIHIREAAPFLAELA